MTCKVCAGSWPVNDHKIADYSLSTGYLFEDQFFPGWTVLVLKKHATELFELNAQDRSMLMAEVSDMAFALQRAFMPTKINYALLGNQLPHIHWHIIPRLKEDPALGESVWSVRHESKVLTPQELASTLERIRRYLAVNESQQATAPPTW